MKNQTNKKPNPKKTQTGPSSLLIWASIILFIIASFAFLPDESANEVEVSYNCLLYTSPSPRDGW
mgnify:CR=1 FL=1